MTGTTSSGWIRVHWNCLARCWQCWGWFQPPCEVFVTCATQRVRAAVYFGYRCNFWDWVVYGTVLSWESGADQCAPFWIVLEITVLDSFTTIICNTSIWSCLFSMHFSSKDGTLKKIQELMKKFIQINKYFVITIMNEGNMKITSHNFCRS